MKLLTFLLICFISTGFLLSQEKEHKKELTLNVKGMVCGACEDKVEKNVKKIEGVEAVKASHTEDHVTIILVSEDTPYRAIREAIKDSGFEVVKEERKKEKKKEKRKSKDTAFTLKVSGMMCGSCENTVMKAVKEVKGIENVEASHKSGEVAVTYDPDIASKVQVVEAINKTRFKVVTEEK